MRIGIFGGTFDPPHRGHLALAKAAIKHLHLDRLLWMLTPDPPHKIGNQITSSAHRLAMLKLELTKSPESEISRIEMDRPGPHYAVDTASLVMNEEPQAEIFYLMGSDSLRDLPSWNRPLDFINAVHFIGVVRRPGVKLDLPSLEHKLPGITGKIVFVNSPPLDIASSEIRRRISNGEPYRKFLLPAVYHYIRGQSLYLL